MALSYVDIRYSRLAPHLPIVPRSGRRCPVIRTIGGSSMTCFVGLDVSQKMTAICVVDNAGRRRWRGQCPTIPEQISILVRRHAGDGVRYRDRSDDALAGA